MSLDLQLVKSLTSMLPPHLAVGHGSVHYRFAEILAPEFQIDSSNNATSKYSGHIGESKDQAIRDLACEGDQADDRKVLCNQLMG